METEFNAALHPFQERDLGHDRWDRRTGDEPVLREEGRPEPLAFRMLGPFQVVRKHRMVEIGAPLQRTLLAALLIDAPESVSVTTLFERLWGDTPPVTAPKSIQKYVSNLRYVLGRDRIVSDGGYRLVVEPGEVDARVFEATAVSVGRRLDHGVRLSQLDHALGLWRGDPFADLLEPLFLEPVRQHLDEMRLKMIEERLQLLLDAGDADRVVGETGVMIDSYPFRERLWQLRMTAMATSDRAAEALVEYQRLRRLLADRLGIDPSSESQSLEEKILMQDSGLRPRAGASGNMPAPVSSVIGREDEIRQAQGLLQQSRLLNLVGTGGVGKTTLALEIARRLGSGFADGAWWIPLGSITDPDRVPGRTAEVLGVSERPDRPLEDSVTDHLTSQSALLVLDNCEHVIEAAAPFIARLLRSAPHLSVVATSRQPLGISGEVVFPVGPLGTPSIDAPTEMVLSSPAVRLLLERAEGGGARLGRDEVTALELAGIARRLDGIPLALELAAAQVRSLGPGELNARIEHRFTVLASDRRDVPDRQQTLEAAIDWSYQLLPPDQQLLFGRLSVFRGGFSLEAAEVVCGFDGCDVPPLLSGLVERSMVVATPQVAGGMRYSLLRTIRQFAESRVNSEESRLPEGHARYFAQLYGSEAALSQAIDHQWVHRVGLDYENLRVAMGYFLTEGDHDAGVNLVSRVTEYWSEIGAFAEAERWLDRALPLSAGMAPEPRIRLLLSASLIYGPSSSDRSLQATVDALGLAPLTNDLALAAETRLRVGRLHAVRGERELALPLLDFARQALRALGDRFGEAQALEGMGVANRGTREIDTEYYDEAIEIYRQIGADRSVAHALFSKSYRSLIPSGRFDDARRALDESLELAERTGAEHTVLHALSGLGQLARLAGDFHNARAMLARSLDGFRSFGDRRCAVRTLVAQARITILEGDLPDARLMLVQAANEGFELDSGLSSDIFEVADVLALLGLEAGDMESAARLIGAGEAARVRLGLLRSPPDEDVLTVARHTLELALGPVRVRELLEAGARLPFEQLADEASAFEIFTVTV